MLHSGRVITRHIPEIGADYIAEPYSDFERYLWCHYLEKGDERTPIDFHPTRPMAASEVALWHKLGRPKRMGLGPITMDQLYFMAKKGLKAHDIKYEDVPWKPYRRTICPIQSHGDPS